MFQFFASLEFMHIILVCVIILNHIFHMQDYLIPAFHLTASQNMQTDIQTIWMTEAF